MKTKEKKMKIKSIIMFIILVILLLVLVFAEDIIKTQNKNKIGLSETEGETQTPINVEPNIPQLSAGMIPIKWDGAYWVITSVEDNTWYDYASGKPAYIMLNDGVYQSELIRDMEGKKLSENNIGAQIQETELGTIFMWMPSIIINNENDEIKYIKDVEIPEEGWTIPDIFMYKQEEETSPDFLLTGAWVENQVDTSYSSKIKNMNKEESVYGLIANTKAVQITKEDISVLEKIAGVDDYINQLDNLTNEKRIVLKIINQKQQNPIKAKGEYDKDTGLITVQVTYSQYGIKEIILEQANQLKFSKIDGIITADTTGIELEDGKKIITIIDNKGNKKELKIQVISKIFVTLYTDGTLAFAKTENPYEGVKTVSAKYGDVSEHAASHRDDIPWVSQKTYIKTVDFVTKIQPISTHAWFCDCSNLTTINNMYNLDVSNTTDMMIMFSGCSSLTQLDVSKWNTRNVTDMGGMFTRCDSLTELDVSNWDTSNVTDIGSMFRWSNFSKIDVSKWDTSSLIDMNNAFDGCSSLTELDVSNWDTSNLVDMNYAFGSCSSLTELDVSNWDTSNLVDMNYAFGSCSSLTKLDVSNWETSNVVDMNHAFDGCSSLAELDVSNWDTSNVTDMGYMFDGCSGLTSLDLSQWDTGNVTGMGYMFRYCRGLTELDVSNWDTSNVTSMYYMFYGCSGLKELDLSSFNTRKVTSMAYMFYGCSNLTSIYAGENWTWAKTRTKQFNGCGTNSVTYI